MTTSSDKATSYMRGFAGAVCVLVLYMMGSCLSNAAGDLTRARIEAHDAEQRLDRLEHRVLQLELRH